MKLGVKGLDRTTSECQLVYRSVRVIRSCSTENEDGHQVVVVCERPGTSGSGRIGQEYLRLRHHRCCEGCLAEVRSNDREGTEKQVSEGGSRDARENIFWANVVCLLASRRQMSRAAKMEDATRLLITMQNEYCD